jgi:hypothetical protein
MGIDPITSNFIINMTGIGVGSLIAIIGSLSACFLKSRCTNIKCLCISCDRDVLASDSEVYLEKQASFPVVMKQPPVSPFVKK